MQASEAVSFEIPRHGWASSVLEVAERCKAVVIGPGIGRDAETQADVRAVAAGARVPVVVDADALFALGNADDVAEVARSRHADAGFLVLTPHSGEYSRMFEKPVGADKIAETVAASDATGCVVLLKGSTTVVADPAGDVRVVMSGGPNLATAGTGDVLSGAIGAFVARGTGQLEAAALAAHVHGRAAGLGPPEGLVAGDIPDLIARWLSSELHEVQHAALPHEVPHEGSGRRG
jgi:NAD(P)H-hydrate epimerase